MKQHPILARLWEKTFLAGIRARLEIPEAVDQADRALEMWKERFDLPPQYTPGAATVAVERPARRG